MENKKRKCNLHTFAYEILYFDEILFVICASEDGENRLFGGYFRTSIAFFRPLSTADGLF